MTKIQNCPDFYCFFRTFCHNEQTSWIRMLKILNMALIFCPVGFFEEIIAVF